MRESKYENELPFFRNAKSVFGSEFTPFRLSPLRHGHQRQSARKLEHAGPDEDAQHVVGAQRHVGHAQTGGQQRGQPGDPAVKPAAGDAAAALTSAGVRNVRERHDARDVHVRHQHIMSAGGTVRAKSCPTSTFLKPQIQTFDTRPSLRDVTCGVHPSA